MKIQFLGGAGTVTGSKYLLETGSRRLLVDCGLFQGFKQLRLRNWAPFPLDPSSIDAVVLTHAHIDHSGYLPLLTKNGFKGPVLCTEATADLCRILLPDSARLLEEDTDRANRKGYTKHKPALPLYTEADATRALSRLVPQPFDASFRAARDFEVAFKPAGHILGSALLEICSSVGTIVFTGDLGRPNDPIMRAPALVEHADYLVVESTYGDRRHPASDPQAELGRIVNTTIARKGVVVIPSFAVGRAQSLLHCFERLKAERVIGADLPVYLNSPMAADVTDLYCRYSAQHRLSPPECEAMCSAARIVNSVEESKALNRTQQPMVIIAGSGMATGGRVVHHLEAFAPDPRNTVVFAGFQAGGTRGAAMLGGADSVRIHGKDVPVRAEIASISAFSAHADYGEVLEWLSHVKNKPRATFVTHGEPAASDAMRWQIEHRFGWECRVPEHLESVALAKPK